MKKGRKRTEEDECPICSLPLPHDTKQFMFKVCCMKTVCNGCAVAAIKRGMSDCPFCRTPTPKTSSQGLAMIQKRVNVGDPLAICTLATKCRLGELGLEKDVTRAVELYERAAELGVKYAQLNLGRVYEQGTGVVKDTAKAIQHDEAAAIRGHVKARFNLGCEEYNAGNYDLALRHFLIAAQLGLADSLNIVKEMFMHGLATKADYAEALRGYQSAAEEMRSPDRDEAAELWQNSPNV